MIQNQKTPLKAVNTSQPKKKRKRSPSTNTSKQAQAICAAAMRGQDGPKLFNSSILWMSAHEFTVSPSKVFPLRYRPKETVVNIRKRFRKQLIDELTAHGWIAVDKPGAKFVRFKRGKPAT